MFDPNGSRVLKSRVLVFFLLIAFFQARQTLSGQDLVQSSVTPQDSEDASNPVLYHFRSNTVWSKLDVVVRSYPERFEVEVNSGAPLSGWILKGQKDGVVLSRGSVKGGSRPRFKVAKPFQGGYSLTLFADVDGEEMPVIIKLASKAAPDDSRESTSFSAEDFQENPDRPFNTTVKNLYLKAMEDFSNGDEGAALDLLRKAMDLDPTQPQIKSLFKKLQLKAEPQIPTALKKAADDFKKGEKEQALAELQDYLDEHPDDKKALELRDEIEDSAGIKKHSQPQKVVVAKTPTHSSKPQSPPTQDQLAQADAAYNLGLKSYANDDFAAAKKFWEETLKLQPNHSQAKHNLERLQEEHPELH
jgi:hypothetical protein